MTRVKQTVCPRQVVMVLCWVRQWNRKQKAFQILNKNLEKRVNIFYVAMLSIVTDCPRVEKSMKAAFSNK